MISAFLVEMADREAYMAAALANTQEPLSKLEIALFAITVVDDDKTESVASLSRKFGVQRENLSRYMKGARLFTSVRALLGADDIIRLRSKAEHLARIADAPVDKRLDLVKQLLSDETQGTMKATEAASRPTAPSSGATPLNASVAGPESRAPPTRHVSRRRQEVEQLYEDRRSKVEPEEREWARKEERPRDRGGR